MNIARGVEELENYRLTAEYRDECTIQRVRDPSTGAETWQTWKRRRPLGHGAFGEVWQEAWEDKFGDWHYRAVKTCSERKMRAAQIDYRRELSALAAFTKSECAGWFVNLHGWWLESGKVFVAMEYFGRGDLSRYAADGIPEAEIQEIADNVLQGLDVMHREGFTHRDIKPENILVYQKRPEFRRWWVKIADFGISKQILHDSESALHTSVGTRAYCAPEVLGHLEQYRETSIYSNKVDMWSLGCVLFNLASYGQLPFSEPDLVRYCDRLIEFNSRKIPLYLNEDGERFLKALLQAQPDKRLTAVDALQHPWFTSTTTTTMMTTSLGGDSKPVPSPHIDEQQQNFNSFLNSTLSIGHDTSSGALEVLEHQIAVDSAANEADSGYHTLNTSIVRDGEDHERPESTGLTGLPAADDIESKTTCDPSKVKTVHAEIPTDEDHRGALSGQSEVPNSVSESKIESDPERARDESQVEISFIAKWLDTNEALFQNGLTALHVAAGQGRLEVMKYLDPDYDDINTADQDGRTPLLIAICYGELEAARWLVENGAGIRATDRYGYTALHTTAIQGQAEVAGWLIRKGASVREKTGTGAGLLHTAAVHGQVGVAEIFAGRGVNLNAVDKHKQTPLHIAIHFDQSRMAFWLIDRGAWVDAKDCEGRTPLHLAANKGQPMLVQGLLKNGAKATAMDNVGATPLHTAAAADQPVVATMLAAYGADVEASDKHGRTPLHLAAYYGQLAYVEWLVLQGAQLDVCDNRGWTPLQTALAHGQSEVAQLLLDRGADPGQWSEAEGVLSVDSEAVRSTRFKSKNYRRLQKILGGTIATLRRSNRHPSPGQSPVEDQETGSSLPSVDEPGG